LIAGASTALSVGSGYLMSECSEAARQCSADVARADDADLHDPSPSIDYCNHSIVEFNPTTVQGCGFRPIE
jgi:hypothetical protein